MLSKADLKMETDVLVIGGGPAGTWAAFQAAKMGAHVTLADKGFCGTSGAAAPSGSSVLYIDPNSPPTEIEKVFRHKKGGYLSEEPWIYRMIEQTFHSLNFMKDQGYPLPNKEFDGTPKRQLHGPEYMKFMRKLISRAKVKILDHSPVLELLVDDHGVGGARGVQRQENREFTVLAKAVVIASGGCAFLSKTLGCNVLTGDSYLLAAEAGAELSGMEFSNHYQMATSFSSVTKGRYFQYATFYYENGEKIDGTDGPEKQRVIAKILNEQPVYAKLDKISQDKENELRETQPNFFVPLDRSHINPFQDLFPVTLNLEGTVRGTGGIRIVNDDCATGVAGLYAAGDASTRELVVGGTSGGGSYNAAWAISSGQWAGKAAALYQQNLVKNSSRNLQSAASNTFSETPFYQGTVQTQEYIRAIQQEVIPYDKNMFRSGEKLQKSLEALESVWKDVRSRKKGTNKMIERELQAMTATARWMYSSALARQESRGMHQREDIPEQKEAYAHRLVTGGINQVYVRSEQLQKGVLK